jgi:hypothetical protein
MTDRNQEKAARLAEALRANLRKRKAGRDVEPPREMPDDRVKNGT